MDRQERINKIKQFRDLAESRLKTSVYGPESYGLIKVLIGHVNELIYMLEPFPYGQFPAADPPPTFGIDPWGFYTETTVPHFAVEEPTKKTAFLKDEYCKVEVEPTADDDPKWVAAVNEYLNVPGELQVEQFFKDEPTADEVHAHTKSCDFRRGLKVCTCVR